MERLGNHYKKTGISVNALRTWAMLFLAAGVLGRGVIQNHILGFAGMGMQQMLEIMQSSETAMNYATMSLALQALETCAAPLFVYLLVEGVVHTSDFRKYFCRVLATAVITEIPYNLSMGKGVLDFGSRNPVFGLVLALILIFFYQRYSDPGMKNLGVKILVTLAAFVWVKMLGIAFGTPVLVLTAVMWGTRNKGLYRNLAGASAAIACSIFSPFFLASPMVFLAVHMCNGEKGEDNRTANYLMYPGMLLIAFSVGKMLF